jgi:hypothetical protein
VRLLAVAVLILVPSALGAVALQNAPMAKPALARSANCPRTASYYAFRKGDTVRPQKLTELPPANAYFAVYRLVGGCEVPVVVKFGVGSR